MSAKMKVGEKFRRMFARNTFWQSGNLSAPLAKSQITCISQFQDVGDLLMTRPFNTVNDLFHLTMALAKDIAWWVKRFVYSISCCFRLCYLIKLTRMPTCLHFTLALYFEKHQDKVCSVNVCIDKISIIAPIFKPGHICDVSQKSSMRTFKNDWTKKCN